MGKVVRKNYTKESKQEVVRLATEPGTERPGTARNLGLHESVLRRWLKAADLDGADAFRGQGKLRQHEEELGRLQ